MIKRIFALIFNRKTFFRNSAVLAFTALLSNLMGLLRDRLLAQTFGASVSLDAYNAAFIIPNLLLNIFVSGALAAAFVPIFTDLINGRKDEEASEFTSSVLNSSILVIIVTGIITFIFAPQLGRFVVPGFSQESRATFISLMRILLISPLIFAVSNTIGNILVSRSKFFWYGMSPVFYNLGIIGGTFFLGKTWGIKGAVIGVIAGSLLHLLSRFVGGAYSELKYNFVVKINGNFKKYLRLMVPKMIGQPIDQFMFLGFTIIGSTIGAGSIAIVNIANNFQTVPTSIIGITFALIAFPILSKFAAKRDERSFSKEMLFTICAMLITLIPISFLMFLLRKPIISILIGGGAFDLAAIALTAGVLGIFTLSITTESINHLLARSFYSLQNSLTPTLIALGGLIVALVSSYHLAPSLGVKGLAWGFFFGSLFKLIFHLIFLRGREKKFFKETRPKEGRISENEFLIQTVD